MTNDDYQFYQIVLLLGLMQTMISVTIFGSICVAYRFAMGMLFRTINPSPSRSRTSPAAGKSTTKAESFWQGFRGDIPKAWKPS